MVNCYSLFGICHLLFVICLIMELFKFEMNSERNLLPRDGIVNYFGRVFSEEDSKVTKKAHVWTPELLQLKQKIEAKSGETFNSCLLNLYHSGDEGMGWHSDAEKDLKKNGAIASVSFGAEQGNQRNRFPKSGAWQPIDYERCYTNPLATPLAVNKENSYPTDKSYV